MSHCCHTNHSFHCISVVPIFSHLTAEEMAEIAAITVERPTERGTYIYRADEYKQEMYVLHTGTVKIFRLTGDGKEQVLRTVGPGEFFGELALFGGRQHSDYAVAMEAVTMCVIQMQPLRELMKRIPSIAFKVMEELSTRLEETERRLEENTLLSAEERLARYLLEKTEDLSSFSLPLSKGDLASLLGMSQETLSRHLSAWQQRSIIALEGQRTIHVTDRKTLVRIADRF